MRVRAVASAVSDPLWPHVACQALLSMEFRRQEYWSGLPRPAPGDLSDPGVELKSPEFPRTAGRFFMYWATKEPLNWYVIQYFLYNWLFPALQIHIDD